MSDATTAMNEQIALIREPKPKVAPLTEAELVSRLKAKYGETAGNGAAYAVVPQVRSAAGFDARRTIDAYVMALWPSRGLTLTAFEIKSSRSDWQRELKNPAKAEEFCELADFFYLVVGHESIVRPGELPDTWGLMAPHGKGLKVHVEAPPLRDLTPRGRIRDLPPRFGRSFLAALLRSAAYVQQAGPDEIREAEKAAREHERELQAHEVERLTARAEAAEVRIREFEREAEVALGGGWGHSPAEVGRAVRRFLDGEKIATRLEDRLEYLRKQAQQIVDDIDKASA